MLDMDNMGQLTHVPTLINGIHNIMFIIGLLKPTKTNTSSIKNLLISSYKDSIVATEELFFYLPKSIIERMKF
jgi:hypothetical protein